MTSWNNVRMIDRYLSDRLIPKHRKAFIQQMKTCADMKDSIKIQRLIHFLIEAYHRQKLRAQLDDVFLDLYLDENHVDFRNEIDQIFKIP